MMENLVMESIAEKLISLEGEIKDIHKTLEETNRYSNEIRNRLGRLESDLAKGKTELIPLPSQIQIPHPVMINKENYSNPNISSEVALPGWISLATLVLLCFFLAAGLRTVGQWYSIPNPDMNLERNKYPTMQKTKNTKKLKNLNSKKLQQSEPSIKPETPKGDSLLKIQNP